MNSWFHLTRVSIVGTHLQTSPIYKQVMIGVVRGTVKLMSDAVVNLKIFSAALGVLCV